MTTTSANGVTTTTPNYTLPSTIKTTAQAAADAKAAVSKASANDSMGQSAFLTLFTTQLKNQDPLSPMDNTAFVSQLAQFSQLEATTKMSDSLGTMATAQSTDRMTAAAALIGKKVSIPDGQAILANSTAVNGTVALTADADSITLKVYASDGTLVRTGQIAAQKKGDFAFNWDGMDSNGSQAADGKYRIEATVTRYGKQTTESVTTQATVKGVTSDPVTGELQVDVGDSTTMNLSAVKRIAI
jgi:flagellar basal-body rod modification protein FlgD